MTYEQPILPVVDTIPLKGRPSAHEPSTDSATALDGTWTSDQDCIQDIVDLINAFDGEDDHGACTILIAEICDRLTANGREITNF